MKWSEVAGVSVSRLDTMLDRGDIDMIRSGLAKVSISRLDTMTRSGLAGVSVSRLDAMIRSGQGSVLVSRLDVEQKLILLQEKYYEGNIAENSVKR